MKYNEAVCSSSITEKHILSVTKTRKIYVRKNNNRDYHLQTVYKTSMSMLSDNSFTFLGSSGCITFVSMDKNSYIACVKVSNYDLLSYAFLNNDLIAFGGSVAIGCAIIQAPKAIWIL